MFSFLLMLKSRQKNHTCNLDKIIISLDSNNKFLILRGGHAKHRKMAMMPESELRTYKLGKKSKVPILNEVSVQNFSYLQGE